MSDTNSSISEEIETYHSGSQVQPDTSNDGKDASYTCDDFESTIVTSSRTTGVENSSTSVQSSHDVIVDRHASPPPLSKDHNDECSSSVLSNSPPCKSTEEPHHQCYQSTQPCNFTSHEFYSKKLSVLKRKTALNTQSPSCHGNQSSTLPAQDLLMKRLELNQDKLMTPTINKSTCTATSEPVGNSPAVQTMMERLPTGQLERLRLEALKHRMSVMIEKVANDLKEEGECSGCQEQLKMLAEKEFIRHKLKLVTEPSILKRLEEHMYHKDSITMLGEVVRSCIRPSSTSEAIWQTLADRLDSLQRETHNQTAP